MATISVNLADDRAFLREKLAAREAIALRNREVLVAELRLASRVAARDEEAARQKASLNRQNPAASAALGDFYNLAVVDHLKDTEPSDTLELLSDAEADAAQGI